MRFGQLVHDLRSYYRGCRSRDLRLFYDLESRLPYFDHVSAILGTHKRRILLRWITELPRQSPILEVGSGIGTFARQLGRSGYQVVALDISAAKTHKARQATSRHYAGHTAPIYHAVGDLRELGVGSGLAEEIRQACPWPVPQQYPILLAADVLEHVPDPPPQTLQWARNLLAPAGRFFVSVPARLWVHDPGHFWPLQPYEWEEAFMASGWHILRQQMSRLCCYGLPTPLPLAMVYELQAMT
ncbi:MAG: class I SAM-dependent methyltransferase [Candidatus Tectimicrobiota bacterium]